MKERRSCHQRGQNAGRYTCLAQHRHKLQRIYEQQPADLPQLPPLDEEEPDAAPDPTPQLIEAESATEKAEENTSGGRRRVASRNATNLKLEEKELLIDFLQQNRRSTLRGVLDLKARRLKTDCVQSRPCK